MAMAFEVMGISPDGLVDGPGRDAQKSEVGLRGRRARHRRPAGAGSTPSDIITRESLENAIAAIAMQRRLDQRRAAPARGRPARWASSSSIDDFDRITERTPLLCDLKPGGRYVAADLYEAGGVPLVAQRLLERRPAARRRDHGHRPDGRRACADAARETEGQQVVRPLDDPIKATGGLAILRGNLAPEGCVVKLAGHERRQHPGPARVFEGEEDAMAAVTAGDRSRATWS